MLAYDYVIRESVVAAPQQLDARSILLQWPPKSKASSSILGLRLFFSIFGPRENHNIVYALVFMLAYGYVTRESIVAVPQQLDASSEEGYYSSAG